MTTIAIAQDTTAELTTFAALLRQTDFDYEYSTDPEAYRRGAQSVRTAFEVRSDLEARGIDTAAVWAVKGRGWVS